MAAGNPEDLLGQVEAALLVIANPQSNPGAVVEADNWLQRVRQNVAMWAIAWLLLQPGKSSNAKFFGANTLRTKIPQYYPMLPAEDRAALKFRLLEALVHSLAEPPRVTTQLCLALTSVAVYAIPDAWQNVIQDVFAAISGATADRAQRALPVFFEFLTTFPQEAGSLVGTPRYGQIRQELELGRAAVLGLVQEQLGGDYSHLAIQCLTSWVEHVDFALAEVTEHINAVCRAVATQGCGQPVFEASTALLISISAHPDICGSAEGVYALLPIMVSLEQSYAAALAASDAARVDGICRVLTTFGMENCGYILEPPGDEHVPSLVAFTCLMVKCTNHPGQYPTNEGTSDFFAKFWNLFTDKLIESKRQLHRELFGDLLMDLVGIFQRKVQWPSEDGEFNREDASTFEQYREDCGTIVMYISLLLKGRCLAGLTELLMAQIEGGGGAAVAWQTLEGTLFVLKSAAEAACGASMPGGEHIPRVIAMLDQFPAHPLVNRTILSFVGCIASWLKGNPQVTGSLLGKLLEGLVTPAYATDSAIALRNVSEECAATLTPALEAICQHYQRAVANELPIDDRRQVVEAMCQVVQKVDSSVMADIAVQLLALEAQRIAQLSEANNPEHSKLLAGELLVVAHAFKNLAVAAPPEAVHPVMRVLESLWPAVSPLFVRRAADVEVIAATCELLEMGLQSALLRFEPLVEPLGVRLLQLTEAQPHEPIVELAGEIATRFAKAETPARQTCAALISQLCVTMYTHFETDIHEYPEVVAAFFAMLTNVLGRCPNLVTDVERVLAPGYRWACAALRLPYHQPVHSAASAIAKCLEVAAKHPPAREIVQKYGFTTIDVVLKGIGGSMARLHLDELGRILWAFLRYWKPVLPPVLHKLFANPDYPNRRCPHEAKATFIPALLGARGISELQRAVANFAHACSTG